MGEKQCIDEKIRTDMLDYCHITNIFLLSYQSVMEFINPHLPSRHIHPY